MYSFDWEKSIFASVLLGDTHRLVTNFCMSASVPGWASAGSAGTSRIPNSGTATTGAVVGTDVLTCVDVLVGTDVLTCVDVLVGSEVAAALVVLVVLAAVGDADGVGGCCNPKNPKTAARRVAKILKIMIHSPFPHRQASSD